MKAFTSGKPRVLRHRQAPLPAPFSQLKGAAGSNAMEEQVSELRFPESEPGFLGLSVLSQSQHPVEKSPQFLCRELKNQAMRLSV
jgi:hypothetical protein